MKNLFKVITFSLILCTVTSWINKKDYNMKTEGTIEEIWKVVKDHNRAWSELEDINEQLKFVHDEIVFVKPPFKEIIKGKEKYKTDYETWMKHAKVDFFREVDPKIMILDNGNFAIVTFTIEMSFKYDDRIESDWNGAVMMTLVRENGR